jgi:hypothetical protein
MAVVLNITYSKKLGLPNYSSHSCSVSVQVEIADVSQVAQENARLYQLLQSSVDEEIKTVGYLPEAPKQNGNGNGHHQNGYSNGHDGAGISEKQLDLVNRIVKENNLSKTSVDEIAVGMFGGGVRTLNRMQASNLIDELFERHPRKNGNNGNGRRYETNGRSRA